MSLQSETQIGCFCAAEALHRSSSDDGSSGSERGNCATNLSIQVNIRTKLMRQIKILLKGVAETIERFNLKIYTGACTFLFHQGRIVRALLPRLGQPSQSWPTVGSTGGFQQIWQLSILIPPDLSPALASSPEILPEAVKLLTSTAPARIEGHQNSKRRATDRYLKAREDNSTQ